VFAIANPNEAVTVLLQNLTETVCVQLQKLQGYEMLRIPHCIDNRTTDGGKEISPRNRPRSTPHHYYSVSGTHLC
jgi:hypothetical protein